jgi:4,4'-diaponeurosporenoate glycosyltransferase
MTALVILILCWLAGWATLARIKPCRAAKAGTPLPTQKISVIIPARNEEKNLPRLLRSLQSQPVPPDEIIVVDDASTDRTAAVATELGARVITPPPLPDGWRGKTWACQHGAEQAHGAWLLFLDADTWFEPNGLAAVRAEFSAVGGGALSVAPLHYVEKFHEQFSAFFNLVMLAGTGAFTALGDRLPPRGLLGQFLLIEKSAYVRVGGHAAVKERVLENFWLAEKLRAVGVTLHCRGGQKVFSFRMYPLGWREMMDGWIKGFAAGAGKTPLPLLLLVIAWMSGLIMATGNLLLAKNAPVCLVVYLAYAAQVGWLLRRVGTFHWLTTLLFPAPLIFYFVIFTRSVWRAARKQPVDWKGRKIHAS